MHIVETAKKHTPEAVFEQHHVSLFFRRTSITSRGLCMQEEARRHQSMVTAPLFPKF